MDNTNSTNSFISSEPSKVLIGRAVKDGTTRTFPLLAQTEESLLLERAVGLKGANGQLVFEYHHFWAPRKEFSRVM